jgi:hypothetical protein
MQHKKNMGKKFIRLSFCRVLYVDVLYYTTTFSEDWLAGLVANRRQQLRWRLPGMPCDNQRPDFRFEKQDRKFHAEDSEEE